MEKAGFDWPCQRRHLYNSDPPSKAISTDHRPPTEYASRTFPGIPPKMPDPNPFGHHLPAAVRGGGGLADGVALVNERVRDDVGGERIVGRIDRAFDKRAKGVEVAAIFSQKDAACSRLDEAGAGNVARPRWCDTRRRKSEPTGNSNFGLTRRASGAAEARRRIAQPDGPADAMVRAMARPGAAGANSAACRTQLIDATAIHCNPSSALNWRPRSLGSGVFISWSGKRNFAG